MGIRSTFLVLAALLAGTSAVAQTQLGDIHRPKVSFASPGATVAEDGGPIQAVVRIDLTYTRAVRIPYTLLGDAEEGVDYVVSPASPLVLEPGEREVVLTISPLPDGTRELDELARVRIGRPDWAGVEKPRRFDLVIANDDCVVPEDFNDCEGLVAPWVFVDPVGDASVAVNGVGTDDAWAEVFVPAGSEHLPFGTTLPARVLATTADGDCTLGCKIDSEFTADGQHQGMLVEQADGEWLRFEVYSALGVPNVFLGSTTGGVTTTVFDSTIAATAPYHLRFRRVGANWIFSWSDDGLLWNDLPIHAQALVQNQVGLYAGNSGGAAAPAHTASFDWFDDLSHPLATEDGPFTGSGPFTLTTVVSPPAAEGAGCFITVEPVQADYQCSDLVTVTAVAAPGWVFDSWQDDVTGTENPQTIQMTADRLATAVFLSDPDPPVITNVQVLATSALVTWDTDEPATSFVEWGPTAAYGDSLSDAALVTSHALLIEGLSPASVTHFQVCSTDLAQNQACSGDGTFSTSILSTDFNDCFGLVAPWSLVDPIGDATLAPSGAGTDDAWMNLGVPAGTTHLPEGGVLAARIVQPVSDPDLAFVTKIESELVADGQHQGVLVEQDGSEWLRFEVYSIGGGPSVFLGSTTGGVTTPAFDAPIAATAPYWLRTIRTGDDFVFGWSDDGVVWNDLPVWTQVLAVAQIGLYAGNSGAAPAHTASFDYLEDLAEPLVTEDGPFTGSGPFALTTAISPPAAEGAGCFITVEPVQSDYQCSDFVTVTAFAAPGWVFDSWQDDVTGTENPQTIQMTADQLATAVFLSDPDPPVISNVQVLATSTSALVTWDTDEPATSFVEWGPTGAYGDSLTDGTLVTAHALLIEGLSPASVTHFQVCSTDLAQNQACSGDGTFSTSILSTDFNDCFGLVAPWSLVDPIGDATLAPSGAGTDDAWMNLSVPAGTTHLPEGSVLAARIVQPVSDPDLAFVTKIESELVADGQHQGVLVEQDGSEWLRFEVYSAGGGPNVFLGSTTGGVTTPAFDAPITAAAPYWLRTIRVGDDFVFGWSDDGVVWNDLPVQTQVLAVAQIGLYAGNSGAAPAHTASFDYLEDLAEPLLTEDGPFAGSGPFTLTTVVSPPAAEGAGCFITVEPVQADYQCSDFVTVTAFAAPGWVFDSWQDDVTGTENPQTIQMTADQLATAVFLSDPDPPVISNVQVLATSTSALVTWDTDEPATSFVEWGPTAAYGDSLSDPALVTAHALLIEGLSPASVTHFQVCSTDLAQNQACSGDGTFSTSILSTDFNDCFGLVAPWSLVDPIGDATLAPSGAGTDDAWMTLSVPAGTTHLPEGSVLAARIVQPVSDPDLAFVTKIESELVADGQHQGVLVEQDGSEWLRFEVYSAGGGPNVFLGSTTGGVTTPAFDAPITAAAPYWLRTIRVGDDFVFGWSDDGVVWNDLPIQTQVLAVAQIGLYAGNSGAAPAHTASFDYLEDLAEPLLTEDGPFAGSGPFTLTTAISPPAAEGAGCFITVEPAQADYQCSDFVTVTAFAAPGWVFDSWQDDVTGTENPQTIQMTADQLATAVFLSDPDPPVISNVQVLATSTSALVTWDTDEPATSFVEWGPTAGYGDSLTDGTLVTSHALLIEGLSPASVTHFQVCSTDLAQNQACSGDGTFSTSILSTDFNDCFGLVAPWSLVDPIGDATLAPSGAGTDDAWMTLSVPAGTTHLPEGSVLAARIVQPVSDPDLAFVTKIESELVADGQHQGVLVEQDGSEWLRFEVYSAGGGPNVFLGSTTGGVTTPAFDAPITAAAPYWLRTIRVGDDFVFGWSDDGVVWNDLPIQTQVLAVTQIGLYAGNSGAAPAHTASFDYLEDLAEPLLTEDGPFAGSGPFTLTTVVSPPAAEGAGCFITVEPVQSDYQCSDFVTVTAFAAPGWVFDSWQDDVTGTENPQTIQMTADRLATAVFLSDPDPPVISNVQVLATSTSALVTWDTDEPATSFVEYGLDASYGNSVSDGAYVLAHAVELTGLLPSTTYHFRVCSTDAASNTACTADSTLTTQLESGLVSDDFNHCEGLIAPWVYVDPIGDGAFQVVGVGTDDAWVQLAVPGGSTHVPFDTALPARIVQPANDADLGFEVKFESSLDTPTQIQGVTIEQDSLNWIRFDIYRSSSGLFGYVGTTVGGVTTQMANVPLGLAVPMYLRVGRIGDDWLMEASDDPQGAGWSTVATITHSLVVTQVGLYAGNATGSSAPPHVASVDSFEAAGAPLVTEDGSFPGSGPYTLTTNVFGSGVVGISPDEPTYNCADIVTLTPVADPGWDFDRWEGDLTGSSNPAQLTMAADRVVDAYFMADTTPPAISNVVVFVGTDTATVTWDTDEPATSRVDFGPTPAYGTFVEDPTLVTAHVVVLSGLTPDTLYHFQVTSVDDGGIPSSSPDDVFQTQPEWSAISDDFNQCGGLLPNWTFVDPQGDAPLPIVQGVGTDDALLVMSVPAGSEHQANDSIQAPHLLQAVNDVDFELEVKFDSVPSLAYQIQGILVKQDDFRWLRFDAYSNGAGVRLYAGTTSAGDTAPLIDIGIGSVAGSLWLNVTRSGDEWTFKYSTDGTVFTSVLLNVTEALLVSEAGLYVGNAIGASSPAHTMLVDYFFDQSDPIVPEDGPFNGGGPFTLTTDVDPVGTGTVTLDPDQVDYTCSDIVTVTAVPAPGWKFSSWSGDLTSSVNPETLGMTENRAVTANFVPDLDPPVISNVFVSTTETEALVTWETDEPADSLVDYGLTSTYTDQSSDAEFVQQHSILLTGLTGGTEYHFRVTSADPGGLASSSNDLTFTTSGPSNITSDDFNHPNLDRGLWEWVDPFSGSGARFEELARLRLEGSGTSNAFLEIEIPAGATYLPWVTNESARVLQPVADTDFELEVKFESVLNQQYQSVGVVVEEDSDTWLRFDFQHTGSALRILRASFDAGAAANLETTTIQSGPWTGAPLWMRVQRAGDTWTQSYSLDGTNYVVNQGPFDLPVQVAKVGPMAGNEAPASAGVVARVDYFFSVTSPIQPEDFGTPSDTISPFTYLSRGREVSDTEVRLHWATDELATSSVSWGFTAGTYDQGTAFGASSVHEDTLLLTGLLPDTTYHFQVTSLDPVGNPATLSPDFTVTTAPLGEDGYPDIEVWYGQLDGMGDSVQRFGVLGTGQSWVNVLGNVQDPIGSLQSLSYTLNGGPSQNLCVGQGGFTPPFRLVGAGDFNVEIDAGDLFDDSVGSNEVLITATDEDGHATVARVWVDYDADTSWPETVGIDWGTVTDLQDAIQVVDGAWEVDPVSGYGGTPALRNSSNGTSQPGYDRLFLIGDSNWNDYEFTFPVTVHELSPAGFYPISNSYAIGVIMRWPGHNGGSQQPREGFFPIGSLFAYRWYDPGVVEYWQAYSTGFDPLESFGNFYQQVTVGQTYVFKGRCETLPNGDSVYSMKSWEVDSPEPPDWLGQLVVPPGNLEFGSLLVLAHEVDASFGNFTFVPLD